MNSDLFTNKAEIYKMARPSYPCDLMKFLHEHYHINEDSLVADIGAGTGKFTERLLDLGCKVIAVEPNAAMANELRDSLLCSQLTLSERPAEATEIESDSIDLVTAAQSFHWFDADAFKKECRRILKNNRDVALIWNLRVPDAPINQANAEVFQTYCPDFNGYSGGDRSSEAAIAEFFDGNYQMFDVDFPLKYNLKEFVSRSLSASYAITIDDPNYDAFVDRLTDVFKTYEENGKVYVPNVTRLYYGKV